MKLLRTKCRRAASILLGLLVLVIAIIVIGIAVYAIYKALTRLKPRQINPDDVAQWVQSATIELETNQSAHVLSDGTMVQLLGSTNDVPCVSIEWTTNLVEWHLATNLPAYQFNVFMEAEPIDKTIPMKFYRIRP